MTWSQKAENVSRVHSMIAQQNIDRPSPEVPLIIAFAALHGLRKTKLLQRTLGTTITRASRLKRAANSRNRPTELFRMPPSRSQQVEPFLFRCGPVDIHHISRIPIQKLKAVHLFCYKWLCLALNSNRNSLVLAGHEEKVHIA